jgi:ribosomal protein S27E
MTCKNCKMERGKYHYQFCDEECFWQYVWSRLAKKVKCPICGSRAKVAEDGWHIWCPSCEEYFIEEDKSK